MKAGQISGRKASGKAQGDGEAGAVVCAVLMPHAPILVPEVGGERGGEGSCRAMRAAARCVLSHRPESLVLISPHSPRRSRAFGLWGDDPLEGSFAQFNAPEVGVSLPLDRALSEAIAAEARARGLETWAIHRQPLDHGALVPLWFLAEAGWAGPTVILSLSYQVDHGLTVLGGAIADAAALASPRRIAIVASGDMSHRLTASAPCGYHPRAHEFDETFLRMVRTGDYREIGNLDSGLRELAAEDAVDSTLIAASAVNWNSAGHRVLNYEGPFGVGYGVAILFAPLLQSKEHSAKAAVGQNAGAALPGLARRSVETALRGGRDAPPAPSGEYLGAQRGVFVTIRQQDGGDLRGCVGTFEAVTPNVVAETWRNARFAASEDRRFPPVTDEELPGLRFEVSVIHSREEVSSVAELDPRRYGVFVTTTDGRGGLLLPGIQGISTPEQQLQFAREKGGISADEPVTIQCFQTDHFEEPA